MNKPLDYLVIHKDGTWYCRKYGLANSYNGAWTADDLVNGQPANILPDKQWCSLTEKPVHIQRWVTPGRVVTGYRLKDEFATVGSALPVEVDVNYFAYDDDDMRRHGDVIGLYEPIYDEPAPFMEDVAVNFIYADMDCAPQKRTIPVRTEFPHSVAAYPETHHKFPCVVASDTLFDIVYGRVKQHIAGNPDYETDNLNNIKSLTVKRRVAFEHHVSREFTVNPLAKPSRQRKELRTVTYEWRNLFTIQGSSYSSGRGMTLPNLKCSDYADAERRVEEFVQHILSYLDDGYMVVCKHCEGAGVIRREKVSVSIPD
jgi:hypothetical protein